MLMQLESKEKESANPPRFSTGLARERAKGQTLVLVTMMMTLLILFVGLGVDTGNLMGKRAKLQSAVDTAALSAAQMLSGQSTLTTTAVTKAYQMLEANGISSATLSLRQVDFPSSGQVHVKATQKVDTFFMKLVPAFRQMSVTSEATADLNSYAEMTTKPYGKAGIVTELNLMVWGTNSWRKGGDAFSPTYIDNNATVNPYNSEQPYGYLYRIDIPASFVTTYTGGSGSHVVVQIFDADSYNRSGSPPAWPTASCSPSPCTPTPTPIPQPDQFASCSNPRSDPPPTAQNVCTSNGARYNTGLKLNAFPQIDTLPYGRTAFWRVDEERHRYDDGSGTINPSGSEWSDTWATTTQYSLWHFDPHITSAFGNPYTLSDYTPSGQATPGPIATYTGHNESWTDLRWYQPSGFDIQLTGCAGGDCFTRENNGGFYFYLYVQGIDGSSENNFDLRVGPSTSLDSYNDLCDSTVVNSGSPYTTDCYVNKLYYDNVYNGKHDWEDGGAGIYAKRSLPLNLDTGSSFPLIFTQVNKNAAGQTLSIKHFDQDCNNGCGSQMVYEMLKCGADPTQDSSWEQVGTGYVGPDNDWYCSGCANPETVQIPPETDSKYTDLFGSTGQCSTSLLRIHSNPSYSQDTTTWQMPFIRPRLIK